RSRSIFNSCEVGARAVTKRNANAIRCFGSTPASVNMRCASQRAASTYVGSFINTKACSGVFVADLRATHFSRSGASKVMSDGGGLVPFQKLYILRRY